MFVVLLAALLCSEMEQSRLMLWKPSKWVVVSSPLDCPVGQKDVYPFFKPWSDMAVMSLG
jgi:hypothetical protein